MVRAWPHDGLADIGDEPRTTSPDGLAEMEAKREKPLEQPAKAEEGDVRRPLIFSAGRQEEVSAKVHVQEGHTGATAMGQMELEEETLILTMRLSVYF